MTQNDGGPAYPTPCGHASVTEHQPGHGDVTRTVEVCKTGMSKLEMFAKAAVIEEGDYPFDEWRQNWSWAGIDAPPKYPVGMLKVRAIATLEAKIKFIKAEAMLAEAERRQNDEKD